jgi:hypothetical protein
MSRARAVKLVAVLRAIRSAGLVVRKTYVYQREVQVVVAGGMTLVYRLR